MNILDKLKQGWLIRHRDWPPFHHAKLMTDASGQSRLCRCAPNDSPQLLSVELDALCEEDGWSAQRMWTDEEVPAA